MKKTIKNRYIAMALVPLTLSLSIFMGASGGGGGGDSGDAPETGEGGGDDGEYTGINHSR